VIYSGTVAGAVEGTILGVPSFALSQSICRAAISRRTGRPAIRNGPDIIRRAPRRWDSARRADQHQLPNCPPDQVKGIAVAAQGRNRQERLQIDSRYMGAATHYYWIAYVRLRSAPPQTGTDISALADNRIAVTPLRLDMTGRAVS
jgi:5'-nucleotidase